MTSVTGTLKGLLPEPITIAVCLVLAMSSCTGKQVAIGEDMADIMCGATEK